MSGLSFNELYTEVQNQVGDTDSTTLTVIKQAINVGASKFNAVLNRNWRLKEATFSTVADQQFYQMPEDCIRPDLITVTIGGTIYTPQVIEDAGLWSRINSTSSSGNEPDFVYIKGRDLFGFYPIPSSSTSNAGTLLYEPTTRRMTAADYNTGTITITAGSATVTGSGTTFTAQMVGRYLKVTDPDGDGSWYKISAYSTTTTITLENKYGENVSGANFTIGELPDIPFEYHEALVDYALYRVYKRRRDATEARIAKKDFADAVKDCKENYSSATSSSYYRPPRLGSALYKYAYRDETVTGS